MNIKRYIFTGMPGSGKTSVLHQLKKLGYIVVEEAATDVIAQEQKNGNIFPWLATDFVEKIILLQEKRQKITQGNLQFYDRSPFCTYALNCYLSTAANKDSEPPSKLLKE